MKIETRLNIGEPVKIIANIIKDGKITEQLSTEYGYITEIVVRRDEITKEIYYLYRFSNNNCLYSEKSLMRANFK